ncbi:MAG: hypothetical protein ACLRWQ_18165 [Flavonifractor plautii]
MTLIHREVLRAVRPVRYRPPGHTVVYHKGMGHAFELPFDGPFRSPCRVGHPLKHPFPPRKKVTSSRTGGGGHGHRPIHRSGYEDALILQDFIPDDS